jgi:uncharacterized lipoprotein NlpE involved in copper resistance
MKNECFVFFSVLFLISCQGKMEQKPKTIAAVADSVKVEAPNKVADSTPVAGSIKVADAVKTVSKAAAEVSKPNAARSAPMSEAKLVDELAAFYTGNLPCRDCEGIQTLLTLNADLKRTFTLEEEYKGKKPKVVESQGTWTVAGEIVTLKQASGSQTYQITQAGLISLNPNGTKRDAASASKYLLRKVMGE